MNRRGFLGSILAASAAPAIVRADALMRIVPRRLTTIGIDLGHVDRMFVVTRAVDGMAVTPATVWAQLVAKEYAQGLDQILRDISVGRGDARRGRK